MTDKTQEALKLALEVSEEFIADYQSEDGMNSMKHYAKKHHAVLTASRAALAEQPAQQQVEHCIWARNGNQPCPHVQPAQQKSEAVRAAWMAGYTEGEREAIEKAQQQVAKPYAYEYGKDNGDGTYSVVIEKGDLVQTAPAVYNYVRPRNAHKDWPIKELFDAPPASKPLTDEQIDAIWDAVITPSNHIREFVRAIEAAHGITGEQP